MTPKQQYERRRAEREAKLRASETRYGRPDVIDEKDVEITDLMDRFVTAAERIADALEAQSAPTAEMVDRAIDAIEGELNGVAATKGQARAILEHALQNT
ncbi:hypothetical protein JYP52_21405 [Nitratireductor aquibiodomus]|uniref:hypothetical protein n=1 Tax=Nitratireductor TaxID=245876 RepID=UPI000DDE81F8|nr:MULTISPECIES: hypothetical protein [Nitratireductor]MBN7763699.1 hypothetical protein [Nitratireductor aquibiodomus]